MEIKILKGLVHTPLFMGISAMISGMALNIACNGIIDNAILFDCYAGGIFGITTGIGLLVAVKKLFK